MGLERNQNQRGTRADTARPAPYPAEKARQGQIILTTPRRRAVFIGGLVLLFVFGLLLALLG